MEITDDDGVTPLQEGMILVKADCLCLLLSNIISLSLLASWGGSKSSVALLLAAGADPNSRDVEGNTCLHKAAFVGNADAILRLVEAKAEIDSTDKDGGTLSSCTDDVAPYIFPIC